MTPIQSGPECLRRQAALLEATKPEPFSGPHPLDLGDAVAWAALSPMLDRMERDLASFRAQLDAATLR